MFGRSRIRTPAAIRRRMRWLQVSGAVGVGLIAGALIAAPGLLASRNVERVNAGAPVEVTTTSTSVDFSFTTSTTAIDFGAVAAGADTAPQVMDPAVTADPNAAGAAATDSTATTSAPPPPAPTMVPAPTSTAPAPPPPPPTTTTTTTTAPPPTTTTTRPSSPTTTSKCDPHTDWCGSNPH